MAAAREGRRGAGPRVEGLPVLRGKHGADLNLAVTRGAVPHTVPGTHAGRVFAAIMALVHRMSADAIDAGAASARLYVCAGCHARC